MSIAGQFEVSISLDGNKDILSFCTISSAWLVERVTDLGPVLTMTIVDPFNVLREFVPATGQERLSVTVGTSADSSNSGTFNFQIVKFWSEPFQSPATGTTWHVVAHLPQYLRLTRLTKCRAFPDSRASDAARRIASEAGATGFAIEDTDLARSWIQPRWNDRMMLEYLRDHAFSASHRQGGYMAFFDRSGRFSFRTTESMIQGKSTKALYLPNPDRMHPDSTAASMHLMQIETRMGSLVNDGAGGVSGSYYDVMNDEFVDVRQTVSQTGHSATTSSLLMTQGDVHADTFHLGDLGRIDAPGERSAFILSALHGQMLPRIDSLVRLPVVTGAGLGGTHWFLGQKVSLFVDSRSSEEQWDSTYSGDYVISDIEHMLMGSPIPIAKLMLVRAGTDSKRIKGLAAPPGGKK